MYAGCSGSLPRDRLQMNDGLVELRGWAWTRQSAHGLIVGRRGSGKTLPRGWKARFDGSCGEFQELAIP